MMRLTYRGHLIFNCEKSNHELNNEPRTGSWFGIVRYSALLQIHSIDMHDRIENATEARFGSIRRILTCSDSRTSAVSLFNCEKSNHELNNEPRTGSWFGIVRYSTLLQMHSIYMHDRT